MQRSHCENENVQFVQELAEVDGPFESPININFRDLTKLELPPLAWNRAEVSPKKMKITNTGHTVIISGKWKCERPYLTGGPLSGKYVFSQIHFHWGSDDCKGSEHQVCGENFPLEMHVAHFKTEYLTQECALREKDGMVVVVYLFKLQDEPNASFKKILNLLPCVKQASTSHALDPKPILSLCNPFTEDYFMYWGSVVTSTCAHILLWIISREPFGISREQVNEFRKILDTSHQPICRNSRDTQPLHRRNVFHVNASKHLDDAMLPIKKVLGCYCRGSEDNVTPKTATDDCNCQAYKQNQEDIEGDIIEHANGHHFSGTGGKHAMHRKSSLPSSCIANQTIFVQTATIHSVPAIVKRFDSEPVRNLSCLDDLKQTKSEGDTQLNSVSKSCCFLSTKEVGKIKNRTEKRKIREKKRPFNSVRAFSQLLDSLEAIKNQTFKKLKEIESINQEIKGVKPFCQDSEDKRWLRRIEKMIYRQKRFTVKSSQGCFSELKKLARECNFDKFFDGKALPGGDHNQKMMCLNDNEIGNGGLQLPFAYNYMKGEEISRMEVTSSKNINFGKPMKFSAKAQRLIQSFFEDIKESDDLQETIKKDLSLKKIESFRNKQAGDSNSVSTLSKGYITQRMFTLGNLGDRFFTAVSTDDFGIDENKWSDKKQSAEIMIIKQDHPEKITSCKDTQVTAKTNEFVIKENNIQLPDFRTQEALKIEKSNPLEIAQTSAQVIEYLEENPFAGTEEKANVKDLCDSASPSTDDTLCEPYSVKEPKKQSHRSSGKEICDLTSEKILNDLQTKVAGSGLCRSSSDLSTESIETHSEIMSRIRKRQSRKDIWEQKPSVLFTRVPSKGLYEKSYKKHKLKNGNIERYCTGKKKLKKKKGHKITDKTSWDFTSTSKEETRVFVSESKWKRLTKVKFGLEMKKSSESTLGSAIESYLISPERKKLKLEYKKSKTIKECQCQIQSKEMYNSDEAAPKNRPVKDDEFGNISTNSYNFPVTEFTTLQSHAVDSQLIIPLGVSSSRKSANITKDTSRISEKKTFSPRSADSQSNCLEKQDLKTFQESESPSQKETEALRKNFPILTASKPVTRNLSLTNAAISPSYPTEISHRVFVETIDDRRQSFEFTEKIETQMKSEETSKLITIKDFCSDNTRETDKKFDEDRQESDINQSSEYLGKTEKEAIAKAEYGVPISTTTVNEVKEKLLPKTNPPEEEDKPKMGKADDTGRQQVLEEIPHNLTEDSPEISLQTGSNKSSAKDASTEPIIPSSENNKERQASISYSMLNENNTGRHHSAESLISSKKTTKRKIKKRPHCHKSSRRYMRKNSSELRKPNKVDSKQLNLLNIADEEQIEIISANVAKFLKQKLVEQHEDFGGEKDCSLKDIKEAVYNLVAPREKVKEASLQDTCTAEEIEAKADETPIEKVKEKTVKPKKKQEKRQETAILKPPEEPKKEKPASASSKPVHNFIKRNKQMAATYKRSVPIAEKNTELKKKEEEKSKQETVKVKLWTQNRNKEKGLSKKQDGQTKPASEGISSHKNQNPLEKPKKGSRIKSPKNPKKQNPKVQKTQKSESPEPDPEPEPIVETEQPNEVVQCNTNLDDHLPAPILLRKIPQPKKRLVPAYMVTSYLPAPIEIVQSQKRKMNKYLLTMKDTNLETYLPDVLSEAKNRKTDLGKSDPVFEKELEYLIKLQMCLNEEITTNIENSMNYVKTLFNPDYPPPYFDSGNNKGVVLVEMKDQDCSSSASDITVDINKYYLGKETSESKSESNAREKQISCMKMPKESGDSGTLSPVVFHEAQENSDSSYDCKISITLKPNGKESDAEIHSYDTFTCLEENSNSQSTLYLEGSSSQSTVAKPHRKKRKDNEISLEMKQKLLEILEGEIKREIGNVRADFSEISSDGMTTKWEDSDGNNRSQSTESSCDNMEMLTQISETMRRYLTDFKERRLEEIITESSDKESRDDE